MEYEVQIKVKQNLLWVSTEKFAVEPKNSMNDK